MTNLKARIGTPADKPAAAPDGPDPTVWFPSTESFAQLLRADNRAMLRLIAEHAPQSLDDLVALTGRAKSNLSRSLHKLADYGIIRIERRGRRIVPTLLCDCIDLTLPLTDEGAPQPTNTGDRT
jgi:predicted transcriptional regulator